MGEAETVNEVGGRGRKREEEESSMRVGDKRRITIPPDLGYGDQGHGGVIPPDSWMVIEVEMMSVGACI
ncbi:hypothetical protein CQW23_32941 [Capsicum baccatum]|uniref:peptidylprolyl isomerase n=1 Tax=Capsicum baccatum TaxID=33114 RepID=A0A2G2V394_CAPBA|nr:hypothetical protein CQW23_32941 [Capsicum baccatum]